MSPGPRRSRTRSPRPEAARPGADAGPGLRDLELAVLGLVWRIGPCTAYAIRRQFIDSPSSHWSGSAGAIYPLVGRLEERGLLASLDATRGARAARAFRITAAGLGRLRTWLAAPVPDADVSVSFDPIRTRILFLDAAPPEQRVALIDDAARRLRSAVRAIAARYRREREPTVSAESLASLGALAVTRARLRWVLQVRAALRRGALTPPRASTPARRRRGAP